MRSDHIISSSLLENKNTSKDCHFPRIQISQLKGLKEKNRIILWAEKKNTFFSGAYNELTSVQTYQITNVKGNTGDLLVNSIELRSPESENEKIRIVRVK